MHTTPIQKKRIVASPESSLRRIIRGELSKKRKTPGVAAHAGKRHKIKGAHVSNISLQAGRASMTKTGSRQKPKGKKPVHVSKGLAEKIKQVIKGDVPHGKLTKVMQYPVGMLYGTGAAAASVKKVLTTAPYTNFVTQWGLTDIANNGHQATLWAGAIDKDTVFSALPGGDWNFFTPLKVNDAASVLFNNKTLAVNGYLTNASNFATELDDAGNKLGRKGLKIFVKNSYVEWELKNSSQRVMIVEFYHCTSKLKFSPLRPLDALIAGTTDDTGTTAVAKDGNFNQPAVAGLIDNEISKIIHFEPKEYPSFSTAFKYEKVQIRMQPGETCQHSIQGPRNYLYQYSKMATGGVDYSSYDGKETVSVFAKVYPDLEFSELYTGAAAATAGHYFNYNGGANTQVFALPVLIKTKEHFDIAMPEPTGFMVPVGGMGAAGTTQQNNFRKNCKAFYCWPDSTTGNFVNAGAGGAVKTVNEENPGVLNNALTWN